MKKKESLARIQLLKEIKRLIPSPTTQCAFKIEEQSVEELKQTLHYLQIVEKKGGLK